jgi:sugar/nucleoside kinase (ribokinase family)
MPAPVLVVGDCLLDVTIRPAGPIQRGADAPASLDLGPGGGAANVAVRLARAGARVRLIAPLATDASGALLTTYLAAEGIELVPLAAARTGAVAILVSGDGERTMLSQRAPFPGDAAERLSSAVGDARWVHLSGYALLDARGAELAAAVAGRPGDVPLAVATPPLAGASAAAFRELANAARQDLLFANAAEARVLLGGRRGASSAVTLAAELAAELGCATVVTERDGIAAAIPGQAASIAGPAGGRRAVDTTGAGDAVAAAVTSELLRAGWPPSSGALASALGHAAALAGEVVAAAGAQARVPVERGSVARSGASQP